MKSLILPLLLALAGLAAGAGAGWFLRPPPAEEAARAAPCGEPGGAEGAEEAPHGAAGEVAHGDDLAERDYVKLNNQFIVPVVTGGRVASMVVLSLSLEVEPGGREQVYAREPKLRDAFLLVLFGHANAGGFSDNFTTGTRMRQLAEALLEAARKVMGPMVTDVLIIDIVRQDA